jgi:2-keto-3-deoxy-galactonokinase
MKDESRHNAFGILYTRSVFSTVGKEELDQIFAWLRGLWLGWENANSDRYQSEGGKVLQTGKDELEGRWAMNLKKLGDLPGLEAYL